MSDRGGLTIVNQLDIVQSSSQACTGPIMLTANHSLSRVEVNTSYLPVS